MVKEQNKQGQTQQDTLEFIIQATVGNMERDKEVHVLLAKKGEEDKVNTRQFFIIVGSSTYNTGVFKEGNVVVVRMDDGKKPHLEAIYSKGEQVYSAYPAPVKDGT